MMIVKCSHAQCYLRIPLQMLAKSQQYNRKHVLHFILCYYCILETTPVLEKYKFVLLTVYSLSTLSIMIVINLSQYISGKEIWVSFCHLLIKLVLIILHNVFKRVLYLFSEKWETTNMQLKIYYIVGVETLVFVGNKFEFAINM